MQFQRQGAGDSALRVTSVGELLVIMSEDQITAVRTSEWSVVWTVPVHEQLASLLVPDARTLLLQRPTASGEGEWVVNRLDLADGRATPLHFADPFYGGFALFQDSLIGWDGRRTSGGRSVAFYVDEKYENPGPCIGNWFPGHFPDTGGPPVLISADSVVLTGAPACNPSDVYLFDVRGELRWKRELGFAITVKPVLTSRSSFILAVYDAELGESQILEIGLNGDERLRCSVPGVVLGGLAAVGDGAWTVTSHTSIAPFNAIRSFRIPGLQLAREGWVTARGAPGVPGGPRAR